MIENLLREVVCDYKSAYLLAKDVAEEALAQIPQWIPCAERMPEEGQTVLVWVHPFKRGAHAIGIFRGGEWWIFERDQAYVTHWMPLPEGPR